MNSILASFNFKTDFLVWVVFVVVGLPVVIPLSLVSHWLIRRYFVASLVGPILLLVGILICMPASSATRQDYVVTWCVSGLSIIPSLLIGIPFWRSRRRMSNSQPKSNADASPESSDAAKPPT